MALSGVLVDDSQIRYTASGKSILEFNLNIIDGQDETKQYPIRVIGRFEKATNRQPELKKGAQVLVEGQLVQRFIETQSGHRRRQPEIHMDHLTLMEL